MKLNRVVTVSNLEQMVNLHNHNMDWVVGELFRLNKHQKRTNLLAFTVGAGVLYLIKQNKKQADKVDRLEERVKTLTDDYHNYVMEHSEYDPDKDDELVD